MISEGQFLLGGLLFLWVLFIFVWRKQCKDSFDWVLNAVINFFVATFSILALSEVDRDREESYYIPYTYIYSLKNQDNVEGSFTLGCGSIEQVEYYYYYFKDTDGYFRRGKKEVNKTVVEESSGTPMLMEKIYKIKSRTGLVRWEDSSDDTGEYKLVVPRGTVLNNFKVY